MPINATALNASRSFLAIMDVAKSLKASLQTQRATLVVDGANANTIINAMRGVKVAKAAMAAERSTSGLNAYAQMVFNNGSLDFVAQVDAATTECDSLLAWVAANFPQDGEGYLLKDKIVGGDIQVRTFTAASLSGLVTRIDALIATL